MNNTLNINRLWKVIKHDGYTFYHKFGLTLAIMFGIPIGIWFINYISAEIGQTGISRYSILNTIASITMILAPARIYRDCNDPRKGIGFATMPASSLEKFISMFFYCIIVTPIIFWAGSIIIDTLLVLIPCKNPYEGFLTNNLFVFKELIEQLVGADNMALPTDGGPAVIQVVMDGKRDRKQKDKDKDHLVDVDSTLLS